MRLTTLTYSMSLEVTTVNFKSQYATFKNVISRALSGSLGVAATSNNSKFSIKSFVVSPVSYSKRYTVNKSAMAFKKQGKEAYNEKRKKAHFTVEISSDESCPTHPESSDYLKDVMLSALKTAGFFNCRVTVKWAFFDSTKNLI